MTTRCYKVIDQFADQYVMHAAMENAQERSLVCACKHWIGRHRHMGDLRQEQGRFMHDRVEESIWRGKNASYSRLVAFYCGRDRENLCEYLQLVCFQNIHYRCRRKWDHRCRSRDRYRSRNQQGGWWNEGCERGSSIQSSQDRYHVR